MVYVQILEGILGGLAYSVSGWLNAHKTEGFVFGKMWPTLLVSAIVGAIAGFTGQDYGVLANSATAGFVTAIVQKLYSAHNQAVQAVQTQNSVQNTN